MRLFSQYLFQKPVVITGSDLVKSALKWNLEYLEEQLSETKCTVVLSENHNFKYYDTSKVAPQVMDSFKPSSKRVCLTISEFTKRLRDWKKGDER